MTQTTIFVNFEPDSFMASSVQSNVIGWLTGGVIVEKLVDDDGVEADFAVVSSIELALKVINGTQNTIVFIGYFGKQQERETLAFAKRFPNRARARQVQGADGILSALQSAAKTHSESCEGQATTRQRLPVDCIYEYPPNTKGSQPLKVLLIDDSACHRRAGKKQLEALGHKVVALSEYSKVPELVRDGRFDIALLDLFMPAEAMRLGHEARVEFFGQQITIGFPLLLLLAEFVKGIAIATDTNHHNHPMSAVVDWFGKRKRKVDNATVLVLHSPMNKDETKDWSQVLESLLSAMES